MTAPHLPAGQAVAGKYTVRSLVAYTGATASYLATDAQGGQVILKLLDPAIGQRADVMGALDRVASETAVLARSSVLPVIDAGYDVATGAPFRASEYLNIPSLARLVDNGPLSDDVTASIVRGVALALDAAHARGLYHHALKPTNLFVGPAPHYPVLLGDFGSRVVQEAMPTHEMYVQSAPWLAPEQLYPGAPVGVQADVYSLALLAFYALTGRSYWWACQSSPLDVQAWQQEMLAPHVPASRRGAELGRPTRAEYDALFARAMATNPAERPASASEFAQAFSQATAAHAAGQPAAPAPPPTQLMAQHAGYPPAPGAGYPPPPTAGPPSQQAVPAATVAMPMGMVPGFDPAGGGPMAAGPMHPSAAGAPGSAAMEAPAAPTGLPTFAQPAPRKKPAGMVPVLIGIVAALLIGVVVLTVYFLRKQDESSETATADTSSVAPSGQTSASDGSPPAGSAEAGHGGGSPAAADGGPGTDQTVQVTFVCIPPCDKVVVDGEELQDPAKPIGLLPGKHTVEASKGGYATRKESFDVELGGPVEKKFIMVPTSASPPPKKKCGKFLKRCD